MDTTKLIAIVGLLVALSAASERMVEIVKGLFPFLSREYTDDARKEGWRKAALQLLAVAAGIVTTLLTSSSIPSDLVPKGTGSLLALGFLASGGSGLWNSVLTYLLEVKNIKEGLAVVSAKKAKIAKEIQDDEASGTINSVAAADALAKLGFSAG